MLEPLRLNTPLMVYALQAKCKFEAAIVEEYAMLYLNLMYSLDELGFGREPVMEFLLY